MLFINNTIIIISDVENLILLNIFVKRWYIDIFFDEKKVQ